MSAEATPSDDMINLRQELDRRLSELRIDRAPQEYHWRQITRYILPKRGRYIAPLSARRARGSSRSILDPVATKAHGRLAAFCQAGITNPALPWLHLGVADDAVADNDDVRAWCNEATKRMMRVLNEGTFYQSMHQCYEEQGGFGTGLVLMLPDYEDVVRFYPITTGEYYLALDHRQEIDTVYREFSLTVSQIVGQFGYDACSSSVRAMYDARTFSQLIVVCHAIEPNRNQKPGRLGWETKRWRSIYFERSANQGILRGEGFDHRPFFAPRWSALSGEAYGTGPAHEALPDVMSLQEGVRQLREAGEKLVNPPLVGDARFQQSYQGQLPGDINWISGLDKDNAIRPMFTVPPNLSALMEEVQGYRKTIETTFSNDLILAITNMEGVQPRNEMEIQQRRQEQMLQLGPMLERFYYEALQPAIRFVFSEMQRVGLFGNLPPPKVLHGKQIEPRFSSVLAQAQKSVGTTAIEALLRLAQTVAGIKPDSMDKLDVDQLISTYAQLMDAPEHIIVDQDKVDAIRQARAAQQQQQQSMLNVQQAAQAAGAVGNIDLGQGRTAAGALFDGMGGGGGAPPAAAPAQ